MKKKNIVLGISSSISAYKACDIANLLQKEGHSVQAVMTANACQFITPFTLQTLTKQPVYTDMFELKDEMEVKHISIAQKADLILVAPATANIIGKVANGIADDALSTVIMARRQTTSCLIAPAMNNEMYNNPIVQHNIEKLKSFGYKFIDPKVGRLACGGAPQIGALANVDDIVQQVICVLEKQESR